MDEVVPVAAGHTPVLEVPLGRLRELLSCIPGDTVFEWGICGPHSWRGIYAEPAFESAPNVTAGQMLTAVEEALSDTFTGWKGGDFTYNEHSHAHLSVRGSSIEEDWSPLLEALRSASPDTRKD